MPNRDFIVIAIDGPAGSGKTTLAHGLSKALGFAWLSTGSIYRALSYKTLLLGADLHDPEISASLAESLNIDFIPDPGNHGNYRIILDSIDITERLDAPEIATASSIISQHPGVRNALIKLQRQIASSLYASDNPNPDSTIKGIIVEGRDIGTVVFPDADVKIYLSASIKERARCRLADYGADIKDLEKIAVDISKRDHSDSTRAISPLRPADDAVLIDNTGWSLEQTLEHALRIVKENIVAE